MISHEAVFGLSEATIRLSYSFSLGPTTWSIEPGDRWLVLGENGAGKSAMLSALSGMGDCVSGDRALPSQCAVVSSGFQNALIEEEIADVMLYLLRFVDLAKIDLEKACIEKIKKNKKKYPISLAKGISTKYNKLKR